MTSSLRLLAIWAATCLCLTLAAPVDEPTTLAENYRLPLDILPINYKIKLTPHLQQSDGNKRFTFDGEVEITIRPQVKTNKIVMHSKTLTYTTRQYWSQNQPNNRITLQNVQPNTETDIITYTLTTDLEANQVYVLHFAYTGKMEDDMHGFYRSSYVDSQNNTIWLGSTQFQTNHARRAFPSFDEPKFKATFDVTLVSHVSMKTYANTRLVSSTINGQYQTDIFKTTPIMSTYLLAFIVAPFGHRFNGEFGIIARPEFYDQGEYSFDVGQKLLKEFDNYLGIKYYEQNNDKMDMAAIPDFSAGAMENWGLLTYRERNLLFVEGSTTLSAKQAIAAVIAHEQAHMWFGDLVTCDWWSYTWLNEGFARYFQYFGTAWVEKDMHVDKQFVPDQLQTVMNMDSTNATNPMSDENTNTPADLSRMFNSISYNKGAVFIRMVRHIIGETNFQKSLNEYLNAYKNKNTIPANLFAVWKKYWPQEFASSADAFLSGYTTQVGYPVIHVKVADNEQSFEISQERFLLKKNDGADANLLYTVPITYTTQHSNQNANFENTTPKMFLPATKDKHIVNIGTNISWLIVNVQETGYYRVNYDEKYWHRLHHALYENNWHGIHETNRAQIVDDLLNLARAGVIHYDLALAVLEYLETEINYLPWTAAFNGYNYLAIRLGPNTSHFGRYILQLTNKAYNLLGFEEKVNDTALDIYNRAKVLSWSCKFGSTSCTANAIKYFSDMDRTPVPVNIRSVVYCATMRHGATEHYEKLVHKFQHEKVATEQTLILSSLGCVKTNELVEKQFWFIVSDAVRRQDKSSGLTSLYSENNENVSPVFKLVTDNVDKLAEVMGGYSAVASVISGISSRFTETSQQSELIAFNKANEQKFGNSAATLKAAEKTVAENLNWSSENLHIFTNYLVKRGNGAAAHTIYTAFSLTIFALVVRLLH